MSPLLSDEVARFVRATAPEPDETLIEMDEYAAAEGFPHVGHDVGSFLRLLARLVDAERVFEFGSGYGYSAYWFAGALPADGEIVLTEVDEDELDLAREYMAAGGYDDRARYELGDAIETIERYDGPFDVVLIDNEKERYVEAFEAVRSAVPPGGVIVADNAMTSASVDFETLLELVTEGPDGAAAGRVSEPAEPGDDAGSAVDPIDAETDANRQTRGVADYLETVADDPAFETITLPIGEGIAVSYRLE